MENLSKLTLVIPSYNRQQYLARNLHYWSGKDVWVIALDGSPKRIGSDLLKGLDQNVSYFHLPSSLRERLWSVNNHLQTKYMALLADDDFYLPSGLKAAINFLEENPDYSACIGRPTGFGYDLGSGVFGIPGIYNDMNIDYNINSNSPGQRMVDHMGRYMPSTMYAVLRSKNWDKTIGAFVRREFPVFAMVELQMELSTSYIGKSMVLPILSWLKSTELEQISGPDPSLIRTIEFHDLWPNEGDATNFRAEFTSSMAEVLCDVDERPRAVVGSEIEAAMDAYVAWWYYYIRKYVPFYGAREYMKRVLPARVTNMITSYLRAHRLRLNAKQGKQGLLALGKQLKDNGIFVDMAELQDIVDYIQNFHLNQEAARGF